MIIEKRIIKKSRKIHVCDECGKLIAKGESYTNMYGAAESFEKPRHLKLCKECKEIINANEEVV